MDTNGNQSTPSKEVAMSSPLYVVVYQTANDNGGFDHHCTQVFERISAARRMRGFLAAKPFAINPRVMLGGQGGMEVR